ncbi:MAG: BatD family protein [Bacteroidota bacterium]
MIKRIHYIFLVFSLLGGSSGMLAQQFTAQVSKNTLAVGERFQLTFRLQNAQSQDVTFPDLSAFDKLYGPSTSQETSISSVNGQVTQVVHLSYSFVLVPKKEGTVEIGPASVKVNGETLRTNPLELNIIPKSAQAKAAEESAAQRRRDLDKELRSYIFIRPLVTSSKVYKGEQFAITYRFYMRPELANRIGNLTLEEAPSYQGFWAENVKLSARSQPSLEVYKGQQYYVSTLKQDILIPQKAGKLRIEPLSVAMIVQLLKEQPQRKSNPRDPFSAFEDFFERGNRYENYEFLTANSPITIDVKSLPVEKKPASFTGMVGDFDLDVSLDKNETDAGEAVTLKLVYSGKGNLSKIPEPKLVLPPDLEVYEPQVSNNVSKSGGKLSGKRTFTYPIIPRNPGTYEIPAIQFAYFDADKKRYYELASEPMSLSVGGEAQIVASGPGPVVKNDLTILGEDIRHIIRDEVDFQEKGQSFGRSVPFALLYVLPFLAFIGLLVGKNRQAQAAMDVAGTRSRKANKVVKKRLSQARKHIESGDERAFYDEVVKAVWNYISDKLSLGKSELSRELVRDQLSQRGVEAAYIDRLTQWIDNCEMALYAPSAVAGGMQATYDEGAALISSMEKDLST